MEIQGVEKGDVNVKYSYTCFFSELRQLNTHYKGIKEERSTLVNEQSELMERKTQLELTIQDLSEDVNKERSGKVTQIIK